MYKNFLKFFLIAVSVTLITNDMFAIIESKEVSNDTIDTRQNEENLGIPNDFIYKGKIIFPHCIIERKSNIIDLEKCHKELESKRAYYEEIRDDNLREIIKPYEIISDANEIRVTTLSMIYEDGRLASEESYRIKFIGTFAKEQFAIANEEIYNGRSTLPTNLEIFYFKHDGDQLIIKPLNQAKDEWAYIRDVYIKNGVLYFSKLLNHQHTWLLMQKVAELQGNVNEDRFARLEAEDAWDFDKASFVMLGAENPENFSSKAFFQMHELDIMNSERASSSAPLFLPSIPYEIEFCYVCRGSFHEEDLTRNPIEIYEDKYCNSLPYIEVWLKYKKEEKQILKVDEFAAFVQKVNAVCESYKKKNNTSKKI
ncbi:hypothetical protein [Rickettsia endosymbiont of Aspidapion aeneum]|uniref:hypothetical protein n=1 Tax=Rickettsia endosymbiont of Aspidapion aeneum TaxID=3066247 RepID=UPI00313B3053